MTEIDMEVKELFVPFSEMTNDEPEEPRPTGLSYGRLYNDRSYPIVVGRKSGGKYRSLCTLAPGSTTEADWWETDEMYLSRIRRFDYHISFEYGPVGSTGWTLHYEVYARMPAGTTNISRFI
ncbi:hypothetical protein LTT66_12385 [Nocardia gipuzkoensis]|uniref:hypothetical protein n=1 Tax=Nocardia gipuzkoensis TaxID=2749991 RepID=UPI001E41A6CD|nr:hypothetical protein [Nocardia gipuzkoensis]UGT70896.1 hypothetical protein LTT66_12385 [Nocardia gipuzkoensis]